MSNFFIFFNNFIVKVAGSSGQLDEEKIIAIIRGLILVVIFIAIFFFLYRHYFWKETLLRKIFWWSTGSICFLIIVKYALFHFYKAYIPDRFLFYALPSPKAESILWFLLPIIIFILFLHFRGKIERLSTRRFLLTLWIFLIVFSLSVAAIREGTFSVYEPFTRSFWEYTGNLPMVKNIPAFLHDYVILQPHLAVHSITHPPGYTVILFIFNHYFGAGIPALAVLVVILGDAVIFPIYYFLRKFATEDESRRGLEIFVFLPSVVMFGATSMEVVFLFFTWLAIALIVVGWHRGATVSFIGGLVAAVALFNNFLFLLLGPFFLFLAVYFYFSFPFAEKIALVKRVAASAFGFFLFYVFLYYQTGFSIVKNFTLSRQLSAQWIESSWKSPQIYVIYFIMNIVAFAVYLGIANLPFFINYFKSFFSKKNLMMAAGFATVLLFLTVGIFQGEVERIWLFITPLFILPLVRLIPYKDNRHFIAIISLLFFQIVVFQVLFYTYW